jgi:hypothetical protein
MWSRCRRSVQTDARKDIAFAIRLCLRAGRDEGCAAAPIEDGKRSPHNSAEDGMEDGVTIGRDAGKIGDVLVDGLIGLESRR